MVTKKWKKVDLLERGNLNEKQIIRAILDIDGRVCALEDGETSEETTPVTRTLSFTINDGTDAIEGATVKIGATTKTTGSAGGCTFTDMADDTYSVEVSKEGFTTKTESITSDETHTSFTISLTSA